MRKRNKENIRKPIQSSFIESNQIHSAKQQETPSRNLISFQPPSVTQSEAVILDSSCYPGRSIVAWATY